MSGEGGRPRGRDDHAVVIGAGFAGLLTARVLADHYRAVTVVEKDVVRDGTVRRPGLPQAHHVHILLDRGVRALEALFPGMTAELSRQGAVPFDVCEMSAMLPRGWAPARPLDLPLTSPDRGVLDRLLRRRVLALPGVSLRDGFRVDALCLTPGPRGALCHGVSGRNAAGRNERLEADLVMDASGRHSRLPGWLAASGMATPTERALPLRASYTSRLYEEPAEGRWKPAAEITQAPAVARGAAAVPLAPGRWLVSLTGMGQRPPADESGFLDYARSLRNPHFSRFVIDGRPLSDVHTYSVNPNRWRLYHRIRSTPSGLLVVGDALCCFNPVYGQGMTIIALQALLLRRLLARRQAPSAFTASVPRVLIAPWLMAMAADIRWCPQQGNLSAMVTAHALGRLLDQAPADPDLYGRLFSVIHLARSPASLLHPSVLARLAHPRPAR
ncbi:NAD(P)/FAD-dependent oxidoreductase [Actinomadura hibisca]|uniref:NAD(P)/FAD-dependent oxidoreductase n=1 Tax=Actinomadura hibisca TaxID=68565 RepID=UPI0012FAC46A|nr:hypothetical protein [Actinomadura hibisca]